MFQARVIRVGEGSIGITIPKKIAQAFGIEIGTEIIVEIKKVKKAK